MGRRRVRGLGQVVVGESKERAPARQLHLFEAVPVAALDADTVDRELDRAALRALAAV